MRDNVNFPKRRKRLIRKTSPGKVDSKRRMKGKGCCPKKEPDEPARRRRKEKNMAVGYFQKSLFLRIQSNGKKGENNHNDYGERKRDAYWLIERKENQKGLWGKKKSSDHAAFTLQIRGKRFFRKERPVDSLGLEKKLAANVEYLFGRNQWRGPAMVFRLLEKEKEKNCKRIFWTAPKGDPRRGREK